MNFQDNILITGARGFIASNLARRLSNEGFQNLILVDELENEAKNYTLEGVHYKALIHRNELVEKLQNKEIQPDFIFHLGARTDTTEFDEKIFEELNINYSKALWKYATENSVPFIYASSAATYGMGEFGYDDDHEKINKLQPLNPYGWSKQLFDIFVLEQKNAPPFWAGLKFFNVYGAYENHKGRMASVIYHAYHQIKKTGGMKLFKSHHPEFKDGEQQRDFIHVQDIVNICIFLAQHKPESAIYNCGTGIARTFNDLVKAVFSALNIESTISYIDTPEDIRDKYQYFTEANMSKLLNKGYNIPFYSLEEGVKEYVTNFLAK